MKKLFSALLLCCGCGFATAVSAAGTWTRIDSNVSAKSSVPALRYVVFSSDAQKLQQRLFSILQSPQQAQVMELPMADGTVRSFRVWQSPILPEKLSAKYPQLKTFTAEAVDDPNITAKLDYTLFGFHAIVFDGTDVSLIDPIGGTAGYYMVHYKKDEQLAADRLPVCQVSWGNHGTAGNTTRMAQRTDNGYVLRTYRLALSCDHQYAAAATGIDNPTIAQTLSKMVTTINRVNGIYERELSVTMNFVENEDTLIWTTATGGINGDDPFSDINDVAGSCLTTNQTVCDARIGNANYDVGHVFTTGAGGLSQVGVVCQAGLKAQSVSGQPYPAGDGFDVDYVAHEIGHEYGGTHPFNDAENYSCNSSTIWPPSAYEPGSGSTIMAYAGICRPDDLQPHSDPYFHAASLMEMQAYITGTGDGCAVKTATGNRLVALPPFNSTYTIPYHTPFELIAPPVTDSVNDTSITYCWEQWNLGDVGQSFANTHQYGPIFRSYLPSRSPVRVFPRNDMVLSGVLSNAGIEDAQGEKVPDVARFLTFRLTLRDVFQGNGCFLIPDDTIHLNVINTGDTSGFRVTSQNTRGIIYLGKTSQQITWNTAGTNAGPIAAQTVDIYMSGDGGNTWPYFVGTFPNTGSVNAILPNPATDTALARLKIKGTGNVFFNVNPENFLVIRNPDTTNIPGVQMFPNPAKSVIFFVSGSHQRITIVNSAGNETWKGDLYGQLGLPVGAWPRGMYIIRLTDDSNRRAIKKFVLE